MTGRAWPDVRALSDWVDAYDRQGRHRTGTAVDHASARWLADQARHLGAQAECRPFGFTRLAHRGSAVTIGTARVPATALFDAGVPDGPVRGRLGPVGSDADIALLEVRPAGTDEQLEQARRERTHRALIAVTRGQREGLALRNAPAREPYGPPVLQVSSRHAARLHTAARLRVPVRLDVAAERVAGTACNVVARFAPPARTRVVVLTPRSGWWQCAAERGTGIACWLAALAGRDPGAVFVATSGHELGGLGLAAHLDSAAGDLDAMWLHLGANLAAAGGELGISASDPQSAACARSALAAAGVCEVAPHPSPVGEASTLASHGLRFVSLVGSNARFHQPGDRFPINVDSDRLLAVARAVTVLTSALGGSSE